MHRTQLERTAAALSQGQLSASVVSCSSLGQESLLIRFHLSSVSIGAPTLKSCAAVPSGPRLAGLMQAMSSALGTCTKHASVLQPVQSPLGKLSQTGGI